MLTNIIPYIAACNPDSTDAFQAIKSNLPYLIESPRMKNALNDSKIIKSSRQPPSLKRLLTRAKFNNNKEFMVTKCKNKRCKLCDNLIESSKFIFKDNQCFKINDNMNCNTKNCIYVLICQGCNEYYIGQTNDLRLRANLHRNDIKRCTKLYVDRHIHQCAKSKKIQFKIMPFFKLKGTNDSQLDRENKEKHFIDKFNPSLNREFNFS